MNNELLVAIERLLDNRLGKVCSDYLDTASACQFLSIEKETLCKLNHRKVIPYYKPTGSKKVYYYRKDLIWMLLKMLSSTPVQILLSKEI